MNHWLLKSEPSTWSFDDQLAAAGKTTAWDGVRNHQANLHLKAMKKGDRCFFYHSGDAASGGKAIVGIVEVFQAWEKDPSNKTEFDFGMVTIKAIAPLPSPVTLAAVKSEKTLADMVLVKNSRLSVQPVTPAQWQKICTMAGLKG